MGCSPNRQDEQAPLNVSMSPDTGVLRRRSTERSHSAVNLCEVENEELDDDLSELSDNEGGASVCGFDRDVRDLECVPDGG